MRGAEERRHILNTCRVLLTRARYETVIWVPRGSDAADPWHDSTRDSAELDAVAALLRAAGARLLAEEAPPAPAAPAPARR